MLEKWISATDSKYTSDTSEVAFEQAKAKDRKEQVDKKLQQYQSREERGTIQVPQGKLEPYGSTRDSACKRTTSTRIKPSAPWPHIKIQTPVLENAVHFDMMPPYQKLPTVHYYPMVKIIFQYPIVEPVNKFIIVESTLQDGKIKG